MLTSSKQIDKLRKNLDSLDSAKMPDAQVKKYETAIEKAQKKVDELAAKMKELGEEEIASPEWNKLSDEIDDLTPKFKEMQQKRDQLINSLGSESKARWFAPGLFQEFETLEKKLSILIAKRKKLESSGKAFITGKDTSAYRDIEKQMEQAQEQLNEATSVYKQAKADFNAAIQEEYEDVKSELAEVQEQFEGLSEEYSSLQGKIGRSEVWQKMTSGFKKVGNAAKSAFSKVGKGVSTAFGGLKKAGSFLGNIGKKILGIGKQTKSSGGSVSKFGKRIFELAKSAFIFNILSKGFRMVADGIGEAFQSYLNYDSGLKGSINGLKAQLAALQGAIASAFAPIISAVVPYLSTFISWVTTAANAVAQFIATLMGKSSYKKAVANVDAVGNAADSTAGSLGDATQAAEELEKALGSYDELNVIDQPKDSSGSSGSGSSGSDSAGNVTYEDVEIDSAISDFAEKVKEAWKNSDFTEVGSIIGGKLNEALNSIPWDSIQENAQKIGTSLATLINGAVEVDGLGTSIGKTIAEAINTGILGIESFTDSLHWDSIGTFVANGINGALTSLKWDNLKNVADNIGSGLADALNKIITPETFSNVGKTFAEAFKTKISGMHTFIKEADWTGWGDAVATGINDFFKTFDWKEAGLTLSDAAKGILNTLSTAIKGVEWSKIGGDIADAFETVDWSGISDALFNTLGSALGGLSAFVGGLISDAFTGIEEYFSEKIEECGGNIVAGIFKGIGDAIADIGTWINDHIFEPFIEGFKDVFGIHSPSTVMEEQGGYIIKGLFQGILDALSNVGEWISTNVLEPIQKAFTDAGAAIGVGVSLVKDGWDTVTGWLSSLGSAIVGGIETGVSLVKSGWESVSDWLGDAKDTVLSIGAKISTEASDLWTGIKDSWNAGKDKIVSFTASVKEAADSKMSAIKSFWSSIKTKTETLTGAAKDGSNGILGTLKNAWSTIKSKTVTVTGKAKNKDDSILSKMKSAWSTIYAKTVTLTGKAKNKDDSILSRMKSAWSTIYAKTVTLIGKAKNNNSDTLETLKTSWSAIYSKTVSLVVSIGGIVASTLEKIIDFFNGKSHSAKGYVEYYSGNMGGGHFAKGGTYTVSGGWNSIPQKAGGGILSHNIWKNIPKYASGGSPHGTMFVAGEAGPEIVGHVGGRTEVLNKSQIASAIASAISEMMNTAVNNLAYAVLHHMTECTNTVISNMGLITNSIQNAANAYNVPQLAYAGVANNYVPDTNRANTLKSGGYPSGGTLDYDKLAGAVASRISNNSSYQFIAQLNGRAIFDETVRQNQLVIKQTGKSAYER